MSFYVLVSGALIADPQCREGAKGPFTTATIRAGNGDEAILVSAIAFGAEGERLLEFVKGEALAVSGRARLTSWAGRDGVEKHGISVVAEQITAAKPRPRPAAGAKRRHAGVRRPYSPTRSARDSGPPLAEDSVADLWTGPVP
jgi:single-stranded DNA-binding protein